MAFLLRARPQQLHQLARRTIPRVAVPVWTRHFHHAPVSRYSADKEEGPSSSSNDTTTKSETPANSEPSASAKVEMKEEVILPTEEEIQTLAYDFRKLLTISASSFEVTMPRSMELISTVAS